MLAIMKLLADDDGMSPELGRALVGIKNQLKGGEEIQLADSMLNLHSEVCRSRAPRARQAQSTRRRETYRPG